MTEYAYDGNLSAENPPEFVTLTDPNAITVFVERDGEPTRVFYDLDALFYQYAPRIMQAADVATETGDHDLLMRVMGETLLMEGIRQSIDYLRLEAEFHRA